MQLLTHRHNIEISSTMSAIPLAPAALRRAAQYAEVVAAATAVAALISAAGGV